MSVTDTITHNVAGERLQQYLLGELPEEGEREVEERLMTDDEYFRGLLAAEDELMDAYVISGLTPHQRARFENHFLCIPERREGVRFAAALRRYLTSENSIDSLSPSSGNRETSSWLKSLSLWLSAQTRVPRFAVSGLALVAVLGVSGLIFIVVQLQKEQAGPPPSARTQVLSMSLPELRVSEAGTIPTVSIPPGTQDVELFLTLQGNDYQSCQAVLTSGAQVLKRWESVAMQRAGSDSTISLSLPANLLAPGEFVVRLSAPAATGQLEDIGAYYFRVVK